MYTPYEVLKFWLPLVSAFVFVYKGWKGTTAKVSAYADRLLSNHLSHIQASTEATHAMIVDHSEKEMQVWDTITKTLVVLEDRTSRPIYRRSYPQVAKKRKKN